MSDKLLEDLNRQQLTAVTHGEGPLLIVAGVGTGKTTVITRRIAWLIASKKAQPGEILALTFNDRAAAEMEERVDVLVPYGYIDARIGTFHSFCDSILRENAVLLGLTPDYDILTEPEQVIFLKERLFDLPLERFRPLGNPVKHLQALLSLFSRAKDEDVTPEGYKQYASSLRKQFQESSDTAPLEGEVLDQEELADVYDVYERLLAKGGFVDFGNLIALSLRVLREHPTVRNRYQEQFRYFLVDEFQDTNHAQFELLKLLAGNGNLTVCGDDDQSIYKFRGAALSNILSFQQEYPDSKLVVLTENYRSTQEILDGAYRLIQNNNPDRLEKKANINKHLSSVRGDGKPIHYRHCGCIDEETDYVAEKISELVSGACEYRDVAVLVRSNAQAEPFIRSLNLRDIPWRFSGSRGLYDQEEIRTVMALLRLLAVPDDSLSAHYLASSVLYQVPGDDLALVTSYANRKKRPLFEIFGACCENPQFLDLSDNGREAVCKLAADVREMLSLAAEEKTGEVLYRYLTSQTGYLEKLSNSGEFADALEVQNLAKFFSVVERFADTAKYDRVPWFVDYLDALIEAGDNPPVGEAEWNEDAVSVLTIHQAKGLEFAVVFLVGLISGRFPSRNRSDPIPLPEALASDELASSDFHRQEERRLFYVGMTRAKDYLYLTSAQDCGGKRQRKPSMYVCEALELVASQIEPIKDTAMSAITRYGKKGDSVAGADKKGGQLALVSRGEEIVDLSHRRIDDYLTCPMKYRYIHILKLPIRRHHSVIFGSAIHQAIKRYNVAKHAGNTVSISELEDTFRSSWYSEGFLTRQHEQLRLEEGLEALGNFYQHEEAADQTPKYVEKRFSFYEAGAKVVGIYDRIDVTDEDGVIIDYKTSQVSDKKHAMRRTKNSRQLRIYCLAYEHLFSKLPARVELRFLTPEVVIGAYEPTQKTIEKAINDIEATVTGIRNQEFAPDPGYLACRYCPYSGICPGRETE